MLVLDILRLSTRMFKTNRSRTILTMLGISVGIGTILFLVSLGYGLQRMILGQITTSESLLSLDVSTGDLENLKLDSNSVKDLEKISGVEKISPLVSITTKMSIEDISTELVANFASSDYFLLEGTLIKKGDFYTDDQKDNNKIIISSSALRLFNLDEDNSFNKKIKLTLFAPSKDSDNQDIDQEIIDLENDFQIIGIIEEENSNFVYISFNISQELSIDNYSKLKVKVDHKDNLDSVRNAIMEKGFTVSALSDIIEQANQIFRVAQIVLALFGIVALIVSAIGMFNTMTIALLERTQEIGIMKAMGASSLDVWNMFLGEAVIIGFGGGMGGIGLGLLFGELFNFGINFLAGILGGEKIDLFFTPLWFILFVGIFSTLVGLITGFYPARRAAKINCLEALRYK